MGKFPLRFFPSAMSSPPPDKGALLPPDELREEAQLFARKLISDRRRGQKLTYKMLARRLEAYGVQDAAAVLNTKVFRGAFPAAFLFICLKALGVREINLDALDLTVGGRERRKGREKADKATRDHDKEVDARGKHDRKVARERRARWREQKRAQRER